MKWSASRKLTRIYVPAFIHRFTDSTSFTSNTSTSVSRVKHNDRVTQRYSCNLSASSYKGLNVERRGYVTDTYRLGCAIRNKVNDGVISTFFLISLGRCHSACYVLFQCLLEFKSTPKHFPKKNPPTFTTVIDYFAEYAISTYCVKIR